MNKVARLGMMFGLGVLASGGCMSASNEALVVEKKIDLSPGHRVMPYKIVRTDNDDLIVLGSNDIVDYRAWATRLTSTGETRWEFLEGGPNGWDDRSVTGQRFYGAIDLPDGVTLLCGEKPIGRKSTVMLVKIDSQGAVLMEKLLPPVKEKSVISLNSCHKNSDGIVLMGTSSGQPAGTGWMSALDWDLSVKWTKFGQEFGSEDYLSRGTTLTSLGWDNDDYFVVNIGLSGEITAKHGLPEGNHRLVQDPTIGAPVRVVSAPSENHNLEIIDFDSQLRGPRHTTHVRNVSVKAALPLSDGAVAILGSQHPDSPTATVTKIYKTGDYTTFALKPLYESPWFIDAVNIGGKDRFVAVRQVGAGQGILDFLSIK